MIHRLRSARFPDVDCGTSVLYSAWYGGICAMVLLLPARHVAGQDPLERGDKSRAIRIEDSIPYGQPPLNYFAEPADTPVERVRERIASLMRQDHAGPTTALSALLKSLSVPISSQLLVFSKTALNPKLVEPENPRAIYFNDEVYVGWVPGAVSIEIGAIDPDRGAVFYTLKMPADGSADSRGEFSGLNRESRCLACHAGRTTLEVPGFMVRSFVTDHDGRPMFGYSRMTHATSYDKRFGGWFVTGAHGRMVHRGNIFGEDRVYASRADPTIGGNLSDVSALFDSSGYPSTHSDLVAHLVFHHQAHGHNLMTRVLLETRTGVRSDAEDQLFRYLVFADEAPLGSPVRGTSGFQQEFEERGPTDDAGRSLRQFDLKSRLFRFRLSYLVHSSMFDGLPDAVRDRFYRFLLHHMHENVREPGSAPWSMRERQAVAGILMATKRNLPPDVQSRLRDLSSRL